MTLAFIEGSLISSGLALINKDPLAVPLTFIREPADELVVFVLLADAFLISVVLSWLHFGESGLFC